MQFAERQELPVHRTQDYRDHMRLSSLVPLHGPLHFDTIAIVRGDKIRTDQQQDYVSSVQMAIDFAFPFRTRADRAVMPHDINQLVHLKPLQMHL